MGRMLEAAGCVCALPHPTMLTHWILEELATSDLPDAIFA